METKTVTAKITSVQENAKQYSGKTGPIFIHKIRFEGDEKNMIWEHHSSSEVCDKFKEGEVATFETEIVVRGQYTDYKIKLPRQGNPYNGNPGKAAKDSAIITYLSCFSSACQFYQRKLQASESDVLEFAETAFKKAMEKKSI